MNHQIGVAPLEGGNNIYICAPGTEIYARYTVDNQHHPMYVRQQCVASFAD